MAQQISTNTFGVAKWVVSANATQGTHTTITSAISSASSGDTIWIRDGNYSESFTVSAGVYLVGESIGQTIITGKVTVTSGNVYIENMTLNAVSDFAIVQSGSSESQLFLINCFLNASANTCISVTTSNTSSFTTILNCNYVTGASNSLFTFSSSGTVSVNNLQSEQGVQSSVNNSITTTGGAGKFARFTNCLMTEGLTCSGGTVSIFNSTIDQVAKNATALTVSGATVTSRNSVYISGSASAMSCSSGTLNSYNDTVGSSNTNAVTGAGTINYSGMIFSNTSSLINTTTQSGGIAQGLKNGVSPAAGFIGEEIRSAVSISTVSLSAATPANITSISLTAGIWNVSGIVMFSNASGTGTGPWGSINTTSATLGTTGDNSCQGTAPSLNANGTVVVPSYRISLSSTTTVYLVGQIDSITTGSITAGGRISAVRTS